MTATRPALPQASERVDACKSELDQVTRRLMQEMQRFHQEKLVDFQHLMLDYVQLQVKHAKQVRVRDNTPAQPLTASPCAQMESAWKEILPELERIDVNEMASFDAFASPGAADAAAAGSHAGSAAGSADAPSHLVRSRCAASVLLARTDDERPAGHLIAH